MNWGVRKPECLCLSGKLKDFSDLIRTDCAAEPVQDVHEQEHLDGLTRKC